MLCFYLKHVVMIYCSVHDRLILHGHCLNIDAEEQMQSRNSHSFSTLTNDLV